jgi:predicted MFS family arabinose efflux permease
LLLSLTLASPVGSAIAAVLGLRYATMLMVVPQLIAVGIALSMREPPVGSSSEPRRYWLVMRDGLKLFVESRPLRLLSFDFVLGNVPAFLVIWSHQQRMRELGIGIVWFGLVQAVLAIAQIAVLTLIQRLERWVGSSQRYLVLAALLPAVCYLAAVFTDNLALNIALWIVIAGVGLTRGTLVENYMHKHIASAHRATAMSTSSMVNRAVMAAVVPLIGVLIDHQGVTAAFVLLSGLMLVAAIYSALVRHQLRI